MSAVFPPLGSPTPYVQKDIVTRRVVTQSSAAKIQQALVYIAEFGTPVVTISVLGISVYLPSRGY